MMVLDKHKECCSHFRFQNRTKDLLIKIHAKFKHTESASDFWRAIQNAQFHIRQRIDSKRQLFFKQQRNIHVISNNTR